MNALDFIKLIKQIYGSEKPDLGFIQDLGLLAIKIGQVHALRIDLLDEKTCQELSKLYRKTQSVPGENLDALIESYVGSDYLSKFRFFDKKPFASASIGQVHKAKLPDGRDVAVKVIKENFTKDFEKDVASVIRLFKFAMLFYPKLRGVANPVALLRGIRKTTVAELNLQNEVAGHVQLDRIYQEHKNKFSLDKLAFVGLHEDLSNEHILVSDLLTGPTVDELLEKGEFTYEQMLDLFHLQGFFMFVIGTFHGDIHPGNIVYQDDKFYFLDTGYIGSVGENLRRNLFRFFEHLSQYQYEQCAFYLNQMADTQISGDRYKTYEKKFITLYSDFDNATVSDISLTKRMMQTIKLGVKSGMMFEEGMFDIIKSLMYMDGMVLRCNPDAVLMRDMRQYIDEFKQYV
ncbi:MAG: AarF/UbiB family protein [Patescibacteria group bacterium]